MPVDVISTSANASGRSDDSPNARSSGYNGCVRGLLWLVPSVGCSFSLAPAVPGGDDAAIVDSPIDDSGVDAALHPAHIRPADEALLTSTVVWTVSTPITLDTDTGMAVQTGTNTPAILPRGLFVMPLAQQPTGPSLLVVQAKDIELINVLTVVGNRPLVLIATGQISIANGATLVAAADHVRPGPGGALPAMGQGAGGNGSSNGAGQDSGGSGGSFGTLGGASGAGFAGGGAIALSRLPSITYGGPQLGVLEGGSGGGHPSPICNGTAWLGGGGGGAVQLTAPTIMLAGTINAGGGGAALVGSCNGNGLSGGGGGSGGAIYLQTSSLAGSGTVAANGGGGGGTATGGGLAGLAGEDGRGDATAAEGGLGQYGDGGDGATTGPGMRGEDGDNGGGGGGGGGRIYFDIPSAASVSVTSSPVAIRR